MRNRIRNFFTSRLWLFSIVLSFESSGQINRHLDIPTRLQWDNANGYCGETSIQTIGLYYGNYISQNISRTLAGGELLLAVNGEAAIDGLSFTYDEWDYNLSSPQYQNYLVWIKQHLYNYHPVIITLYMQGMSDPDYDHIVPAIGFSSTDTATYHNADELIFNDNYDSTSFIRTFQSIWDTRSMNGNGAGNLYCVPKNVDYGCAVTGIKDVQHVTKPVSVSIDRWDEPNVTLGESPVMLHASVTASNLSIGNTYALLKYNNYTHVPSSNFNPLNADGAFYFTATGITKTVADSFMSNTAMFYRCIPYNMANVTQEVMLGGSGFNVYPNPMNGNAKIVFDLSKSQPVSLKIVDIYGKELLVLEDKLMDAGKYTLPFNSTSLAPGIYFCFLKTENEYKTIKVEIVK